MQGSRSSSGSVAAHTGRAHGPVLLADEQEHHSDQSITHSMHSELTNCSERAFMARTCYRGVKQEAGMRNAPSFIQKDHVLNAQCCLDR